MNRLSRVCCAAVAAAGLALQAWAYPGRPAPPVPLVLAPPATVAQALKRSGIAARHLTFYAQRLEDARTLAAYHEEEPFVLASTTKIVTSLAALNVLGAQYRWRTYAYLRGPLENGRLRGDLLIVGGGDASLTTDELFNWFAALRERGLREIGGNIVLDRHAFRLSESDHAGTPPPSPLRPHHAWPDALCIHEGRLRLRPLQAAGLHRSIAKIETPAAPARDGGDGGATPWFVEYPPLPAGEPAHRTVAALWARAGGTLRGSVLERTEPVEDASALPRDAEGELLMPFAVHRSARLPELIRDINKWSDNQAARNLLLSLSSGFPLRAATLPDARKRVQQWLATQGLGQGDIEIDNGSGLSRAERGKARAMVQLLANAWRSRNAQPFIDSLPVAGRDGTLMNRLRHGDATGQAYLKTGTLRDARALAGYVRARSGKLYAVTAIVNDPNAGLATPVLDAFIEWVAHNG